MGKDADWCWYEEEYPEAGSHGPFPTREAAVKSAEESDCVVA